MPVKVTGAPGQTIPGLADPAITGRGLTVMVIVAVFVQPFTLVPVTVYVVVVSGETLTLEPDNDPGCQVYVFAPLQNKLVEVPAQMVEDDAVVVNVGTGETTTGLVATRVGLVHPVAILLTCA